MLSVESLGLSANQWQFLSSPDTYVKESARSGGKLVIESTRRQFLTARDILARLNGSYDEVARRGLLLADDVGLGKTSVAALVAWVVASAGGEGRRVRILAPNDVMMRRWEEELLSHVAPLQACAPMLRVSERQVKARRGGNLMARSIQVVKHSYAKEATLACDLLIVDEAHRAKGEHTQFSKALKKHKKKALRVLILTATPFSIHLDELARMLSLIGGDASIPAVRRFSRSLDDLYSGSTSRSEEVVAESLAGKARAAIFALKPYVIRHGIDDLPQERKWFGNSADWHIDVPQATSNEVELMVRMDRSRRVVNRMNAGAAKATNDPRFHVGWREFDAVRERMMGSTLRFGEPVKAVVENNLTKILLLRDEVGTHSKIAAVASEVKSIIQEGEKVVVFCHHIATAQELTAELGSSLPRYPVIRMPNIANWKNAWEKVLLPWDKVPEALRKGRQRESLRDTFIEWLCADLIRSQTWSWISSSGLAKGNLIAGLRKTRARDRMGAESIADAAQYLFLELLKSRSSRQVLKDAEDRLELLPGTTGQVRVLGICEKPTGIVHEEPLFIRNSQPDTIRSIFNSPFGPDVIVATDKLSEGIDLHRYCRYLIHYELDPSPIRTVQRNGRIRRVNSWAAATGQDICYAYPAFHGTRDHRLVQIMKKRIGSFSLLLGGVKDFDVEEIVGSDEKWRNEVIALAKRSLTTASKHLCAKDPNGN